MLLRRLVTTSEQVAATRSRNAKVAAIATLLAELDPEHVATVVSWLSGETRQLRLDVGWAAVRDVDVPPASEPTLTVAAVDRAFDALAAASGAGARGSRVGALAGVLTQATEPEQRFLRGLVLGELRQGALAGVVTRAVAEAADVDEALVRRAAMLSGDLGAVARDALSGTDGALDAYRLELFRPVQPMLASTAPSVTDALADLGRAIVERKIDGARVQIHRDGDEIRVYTRNLRDITDHVPDLVTAARELTAERYVVDGEAVALRADGRPHTFQVTMSRFGRSSGVDDLRDDVPLSLLVFDVLHADGDDVLDQPLRERRARLEAIAPPHLVTPAVITDVPDTGEAYLDDTIDAGHEGVMVKDLESAYEAGRRGRAWRKVKLAHTLDLVVLAVEWGSGRRKGWLSNLHLGARDAVSGQFVMLGKTFKGLTDELLDWQTERFLELQTHRDGHVVHVRPEQVVEVAFDGVQTSRRYPAGMALRFARVKGYRHDKAVDEADTLDTVRAIHRGERAPRRRG